MSQIQGRLVGLEGGPRGTQPEFRKPYARPRIVLELELETRAGSPLLIDPLLDPLSPMGSEGKK